MGNDNHNFLSSIFTSFTTERCSNKNFQLQIYCPVIVYIRPCEAHIPYICTFKFYKQSSLDSVQYLCD